MLKATVPARTSDTPTLRGPEITTSELRGVAWHLALLAQHSAAPVAGDVDRFLRGLLAVALQGEAQQ